MSHTPRIGAALALTAVTAIAGPAAAEGFSAIDTACSIELGKAAAVEHFTDMKALHDSIRLESDDPAKDAAAAAAELCPGGTCEAGEPLDWRNGIYIHVLIPDGKGGAHLLREMGWIGGSSACAIGEPSVKALGDGLYRITVDERTGSVNSDGPDYCTDDGSARSELLLDLGQKRWLVYAVAVGADDRLDVKDGRVKATACGKTLDASLAALKAGEAQLGGAKPGGAEPGAPKPTADAVEACETVWPRTAKADRHLTWRCLTHYLTYAYGQKPDAEALTLDPGYGHPSEVKLSLEDLDRMIASTKAACDVDAAPVESECARGHELLQGMRSRRLGLFENVAVGSIEAQLRKVLAGQELTEADLFVDDEGMDLSPLSLWKLRNAAYARHGYQFKTADLNTFFYGPREPVGEPKLLPLETKGTTKKVELSKADTANVRLIKLLEGRAEAR